MKRILKFLRYTGVVVSTLLILTWGNMLTNALIAVEVNVEKDSDTTSSIHHAIDRAVLKIHLAGTGESI